MNEKHDDFASYRRGVETGVMESATPNAMRQCLDEIDRLRAELTKVRDEKSDLFISLMKNDERYINTAEELAAVKAENRAYFLACHSLDEFLPFFGVDNCERIRSVASTLSATKERLALADAVVEAVRICKRNIDGGAVSLYWVLNFLNEAIAAYDDKAKSA